MTRKQRLTLTCATTIVCLASLALTPEARSAAPTVIYSFAKKEPLGLYPTGTLLADKNGVLYGGTSEGKDVSIGGSVFSLTPPVPGQTDWTSAALYTFSQGFIVKSGLVADASGNLYGTATYSQGPGLVFELMPPAKKGGIWTLQTIHAFSDTPDGSRPNGDLRFDAAGSLYGTTTAGGANGQGVVFELTPPQAGQTAWTESILYSVQTPDGNTSTQLASPLVIGEQGKLYGVTSVNQNQGQKDLAFELSPPSPGGTTWSYETIATFQGTIGKAANPGLSSGPQGVLYGITHSGSTNHCGAVFSLVS